MPEENIGYKKSPVRNGAEMQIKDQDNLFCNQV